MGHDTPVSVFSEEIGLNRGEFCVPDLCPLGKDKSISFAGNSKIFQARILTNFSAHKAGVFSSKTVIDPLT